MMKLKYIKSLFLILFTTVIIGSATILTNNVTAAPTSEIAQNSPCAVQQTVQSATVAPLAVVNNPKVYLNKNIVMNAKFDKFSTLGLDYKTAMRSSEDYISFLIKRDDTSFNIPLSEMKLFLKRDVAEKFIDLKTNDEIEIKGFVFSDALGDPWIDVKELKITKKAPEEDKDKK